MLKSLVSTVVAGLLITLGTSASGDELDAPPILNERSEADYYQPPVPQRYEPDTGAIVRQKAMVRGEQRAARLASSTWYGISNSRPTTAATPFTSRYGHVWEMPGGRPYSWYPIWQPTYVVYTR